MIKKVSLFCLLFLLWALQSFAQIQGVVKDEDTGEPIPFVSIFYEGKGVGCISDIDGRFKVDKMVEWKELTFSSVGYTTKVVPISAKTEFLNVSMKVMDHTLDEIVVRPKREKYSRKNILNLQNYDMAKFLRLQDFLIWTILLKFFLFLITKNLYMCVLMNSNIYYF